MPPAAAPRRRTRLAGRDPSTSGRRIRVCHARSRIARPGGCQKSADRPPPCDGNSGPPQYVDRHLRQGGKHSERYIRSGTDLHGDIISGQDLQSGRARPAARHWRCRSRRRPGRRTGPQPGHTLRPLRRSRPTHREHQADPDTYRADRVSAGIHHHFNRWIQASEVWLVRTGVDLQLQPSGAFLGIVFGGFQDDPAHVIRRPNGLPRRLILPLEIRPVPWPSRRP